MERNLNGMAVSRRQIGEFKMVRDMKGGRVEGNLNGMAVSRRQIGEFKMVADDVISVRLSHFAHLEDFAHSWREKWMNYESSTKENLKEQDS